MYAVGDRDLLALSGVEVLPKVAADPRSEGALQILDRGMLDAADRSEPGQQALRAARPDTGNVDEFGGEGPLAAALPMAGDGEAVGLVPGLPEHEVRRV